MEASSRDLRVVITAAAAGIGQAIASSFLEIGARVHICDIDKDGLEAYRETWPDVGITVADVSQRNQVDALFDEAVAGLGGLDILVNNAGIAGPTGPVEEIEPEAWEQTIAVNLNSQFYCTRRAVPLLKQNGGGTIINLSSAAGLFGFPLRSPYASSKWAIIGFTKTLAMELGEFGIRVNAICPGLVAGPRIDGVISARAAVTGVPVEEMREEALRTISMRTFVTAEDVANMVLFLCSDAGSRISGQALSVDGNVETLRT